VPASGSFSKAGDGGSIQELPDPLTQDARRADVEALLSEAVRYIVHGRTDRGYENPGLTSVGLSPGIAEALGVDPTGLLEAVSRRSGVPVWDGSRETYCDISGYRPYKRFVNPGTSDYRVGLTLRSFSGDTVSVSYQVSAGSVSGSGRLRNLRVVRLPLGWSAEEGDGLVIGGPSSPCRPPAPETPDERISAAFGTAILHLLENPVEDPPPIAVTNLCVSGTHYGYPWGSEVLEGVQHRLGAAGYSVFAECMQADEESGIRMATADGNPAMSFHLRFVLSENSEEIRVQVEYVAGNRNGTCERFFGRPCVVECTLQAAGEDWTNPSCSIPPFSRRERRGPVPEKKQERELGRWQR
jgi:hypothetical protein